MTTKVIILATDSGDREDGSVNYSDYFLVSSETLGFDEPIFREHSLTKKEFFADDDEEAKDFDPDAPRRPWQSVPYSSKAKVIEHFRSLGYQVEEANVNIFWAYGYSE